MVVRQLTVPNDRKRVRAAPRLVSVPPLHLESGDRLTRPEFERRYAAMPNVKKAELIEGVVYMPSPVHHSNHGKPHAQIIGWLAAFCAATPGVELSDNATLRLDPENEVQPDALLRRSFGGRSRVTQDDYLEGAPELIVEVAATSAGYDLHDKKRVYRRTGVPEYIVWQMHERRLDWFALHEGEYVPLRPDSHGVIRSQIFPGLRLAATALLKDDLAGVLKELQRGLKSSGHAAFVRRMRLARQIKRQRND